MNSFKLQAGCLIIVLFIAVVYAVQRRRYDEERKFNFFDLLLVTGTVSLIFDGLTAYTVNVQDFPKPLNLAFHAVFFLSLDSVMFVLFLYMLSTTGGLPKSRVGLIGACAPYFMSVIAALAFLGDLRFEKGETTDYSMGVSVYVCFAMVAVYTLLAAAVFLKRWRMVEVRKRVNVAIFLSIVLLFTAYQAFVPESLITSVSVTALILGAYLNEENPALKELAHNHTEMVTGFATLIENRDESTGEHVRRTTAYVRLIVDGLLEQGSYRKVLTRDYIDNLFKAAPLHDVGKIAVPDAVLQKPGRLTDEEYEIIKTHTVHGGRIIRETFGKTGNEPYCRVAESVALRHHEKWGGGGYPDGLKGTDIPLCARIMAVADVFDAVSEKRCYRAALPLEECFAIIERGRGSDFEPAVVDAFLSKRTEVEKIHGKFENVFPAPDA
ncbi:MAG: HD domain-containing protein [Candidatus Borkfalkiaceae bacterium]|nr:HD domain-containing protein [Christensenellaceae bacterium]